MVELFFWLWLVFEVYCLVVFVIYYGVDFCIEFWIKGFDFEVMIWLCI